MADPIRMGFERGGLQGGQDQARLGDLLWDAHAAGSKLLEYTEGRDWEEFRESELLQAFAHKMLELMGESLRELGRRFPEEYARIPGVEALESVDGQASVQAIWKVVQEPLPGAVAEVRGMLEDWHGGAAFGADTSPAHEPRVVYEERAPEYEE